MNEIREKRPCLDPLVMPVNHPYRSPTATGFTLRVDFPFVVELLTVYVDRLLSYMRNTRI